MPSTSLPPLPRVARYRSSLVRSGTSVRPWSYLAVPRSDPSRLTGFAEVQAIVRDLLALGVEHTALVQCRHDRSLVGVLLDPPHDVSLRIGTFAAPVLPAPTVLVVEVAARLAAVRSDDIDGVHSLRTIYDRQSIELLDVVRTDGDVVLSLSIAGRLVSPWQATHGVEPQVARRGR